MKKIFIASLFASLILSGCSSSFDKNSGEVDANLTKLPTPTITEVLNNYVYWNEVPNASSYTIKINSYQESTGNQLKYSISSIIDSRIDYNVPTELHIYVKANGNQIMYSDSDWSSEYSYTYTKINGEISGNNSLDYPKNIDFKDNKITWDIVENASYYQVEITTNDSTNTENRSINYYDVAFDKDTSFSYRIRSVKDANESTVYSAWSASFTAKYIKGSSKVSFDESHYEKGLGRTVDLINGAYNEVMIGGSSIFDEVKLSKLYVGTNSIKKGHQVTYTGDSIEKYIDEYTQKIGVKFSLSKIKPGLKKLVSQKSLGLDLSYNNEYTARTESETSYYFYTLENSWQNEEIYFNAYRNSNLLSNALSDDFLDEARNLQNNINDFNIERFINLYGTHLITDVIYGSKLSVNYTLIGEKSEVESKCQNQIGLDLGISKNYWEISGEVDLDFKSSNYSSSSNLISNITVDFKGGENTGFVFDKNNTDGFKVAYGNWAKSTNDSKNDALIDVGDNSLYCIWDLLDDNEFSSLKKSLDDYFDKKASASYEEYSKKINRFIEEEKDVELNLDTIGNGSVEVISVNGEQKANDYQYKKGDEVKICATPFDGYKFYSWDNLDENIVIANATDEVTFDSVKSNSIIEIRLVDDITSLNANFYTQSDVEEFSFYATIKTDIKISFNLATITNTITQGLVQFTMIGIPVVYNNVKYIYGNAYYNGNIAGGSRQNNVHRLSLVLDDYVALFGGLISWSGSKGDNNESGMAAWDPTYEHNQLEISYLQKDLDNDFAGNEEIKINIMNCCISTNEIVDGQNNYPEMEKIEKAFYTELYTEKELQAGLTFEMYGIRLMYNNAEYLYGCAYFSGNLGGHKLINVADITLYNSTVEILNGGIMVYAGNKDNYDQRGLYSNYALNNNLDGAYYMAENGNCDFEGTKDIAISITNIYIKLNDSLSKDVNYLGLVNNSFSAKIDVETGNQMKFEDKITFSMLGIDAKYNDTNVVIGFANYIGKIRGEKVNDCATISLTFDEEIAYYGGLLHYYGNYDIWETEGTAFSYSNGLTNSLYFYADDCGADFPGKDATNVIIYLSGLCMIAC